MPEIVTGFPATEQGLRDALHYVEGQIENGLLGTDDEVWPAPAVAGFVCFRCM